MYDMKESQIVLRKLIKDYFATLRHSSTIGDNKTWVLETSLKINNYYGGKGRWVRTVSLQLMT